MATKTTGQTGRLAYVDGLRALCALEVVAGHIELAVWPNKPPGGIAGALLAFTGFGHTAVSVFIILSGFCLAYPVARAGWRISDGAWGFYARRARRILPPYYLAMAFTLVLIWLFIGQKTGTDWDHSLPVTWQDVLVHLALIQDVAPSHIPSINYAFWSIAMECQIYLLFPLFILLWRRYHPLFVTLVTLALSLVVSVAILPTRLGQQPGYIEAGFAPQYVGLFAMGMFAAWLIERETRWRGQARWIAGALGLACWVVVVILHAQRDTTATFLLSDCCAGVGAVVLLVIASQPMRSTRSNPLAWRPLVWIGGFSYSLYLIHAPLIQLLWQYGIHPLRLGDTSTYLLLLLLGLPLIILGAWGFWYVCERPFMAQHRERDNVDSRQFEHAFQGVVVWEL